MQDAAEGVPDERTLHYAAMASEPADTFAHALVLHSPGRPPRRFPLAGGAVTVGRVMPNTIVLDDTAVSRRHCQIEIVGEWAEATDLGSTNGTFVDGVRLAGPARLEDGARLRVGPHELRYERRRRSDMEAAASAQRELEKAQSYVNALLPPPIAAGPVQANWVFQPCDALGGDAFGYQAIEPDWFVAYIIDVSGHGTGAAMLSVSVMNVLRQRLLPGVDMRDPAAVLGALNAMFDMDTQHGLYFTMWYGAYHLPTRRLSHAAAGHHAALLIGPGEAAPRALGTRNIAVGMRPGYRFTCAAAEVPPGSRLYLYSDGAFEIVPADGRAWGQHDVVALLAAPPQPGLSGPERIYGAVRAAAVNGHLADDFSVVELIFD